MKVLVVGGGSIGTAVVHALQSRGHEVALVSAPRYATSERDVAGLRARAVEIAKHHPPLSLGGVDVVVNCAGLAAPTSGLSDELVGANALLPAVLAAAVAQGQMPCRFVHVSSASVQGAGVLDESPRVAPWSPYSDSKALGEQVVREVHQGSTIYRPASVHGPDRGLTQSLTRFASSMFSSVAGIGDGPSPVAHVCNVADGIAHVVGCHEAPPIVLHPSDGFTCAELMRLFGDKEPHRIPRFLARSVLAVLRAIGRLSSRSAAIGRRLDVTWFGQPERATVLTDLGWSPVVGPEDWRAIAQTSRDVA